LYKAQVETLENGKGMDLKRREREDLDVFFNPRSVVVIGATERPGSWGSFIMESLLSQPFKGRIYPVNRRAREVYGIPSHPSVGDIPDEIDLAIVVTPEKSVEDAIVASGGKNARGMVMVTAGFGEVSRVGSEREKALAGLARSLNMRILGPNVSGVYNLHAGFNASGSANHHVKATPLAAVSQGGYAFHDLVASGSYRGMGVGQFVQTGNECDLTVNDFLEYFGEQNDVKGVVLYVETLRDGKGFMEIARRVGRKKPIILHKAGRTVNSARAAPATRVP
jgi:acetate---CoA ligase (ADP-forming) subunit alpha